MVLAIICCCQLIFAQDKIYRKNGQIVNCKKIETGTETVKYKPTDKV
jgi:hypothetical protein